MNASRFEFSDFFNQAAELGRELRALLANGNDETLQALLDDIPAFECSETRDTFSAPLTVAFVGQYNAGKSTIISALTGKRDILINADVCTDQVTAYDWHGIRLLDTPGIHAGYHDHDEISYAAIDRADLLVFVISDELFDDLTAAHFRTLCFERHKASEILLVVNKMGQNPGAPETKLPGIERVTRPRTPKELQTAFIDAESYIEAIAETDEADRRELLEIANFDALVDGLNAFVRDQGFMGRLTTPLFQLRAAAEQAQAFLSTDMPEERAAIELLRRRRGLLHESRSRLCTNMQGLISAAASDLIAIGDAVAEAVEPGANEASLKAWHETAQENARERCERLAADAHSAAEAEIAALQRQMQSLENSPLTQELKSRVSARLAAAGGAGETRGDASASGWPQSTDRAAPGDWFARTKKAAAVAETIGTYTSKWTTGPMAAAGNFGTRAAVSGSAAHRTVYNVGKFFGAKFKPWGAVNIARNISVAGRAVSAIGGLVGVAAQIAEDKQNEQQRQKLRESRNEIRNAYRESVRDVEHSFWDRFDQLDEDFYSSELADVDEILTSLLNQQTERGHVTDHLREISASAMRLIEDMQNSSRSGA